MTRKQPARSRKPVKPVKMWGLYLCGDLIGVEFYRRLLVGTDDIGRLKSYFRDMGYAIGPVLVSPAPRRKSP